MRIEQAPIGDTKELARWLLDNWPRLHLTDLERILEAATTYAQIQQERSGAAQQVLKRWAAGEDV